MDDTEYYAMMRRQYSNPVGLNSKKKQTASSKTPGTFSEWTVKHGHEDAEMFEERNRDSDTGIE